MYLTQAIGTTFWLNWSPTFSFKRFLRAIVPLSRQKSRPPRVPPSDRDTPSGTLGVKIRAHQHSLTHFNFQIMLLYSHHDVGNSSSNIHYSSSPDTFLAALIVATRYRWQFLRQSSLETVPKRYPVRYFDLHYRNTAHVLVPLRCSPVTLRSPSLLSLAKIVYLFLTQTTNLRSC